MTSELSLPIWPPISPSRDKFGLSWIMGDASPDNSCKTDVNCSNHGNCQSGQCHCQVNFAGPHCTSHNGLYFTSFSLVFYLLTTLTLIQLFICIRSEYVKLKKKSIVASCRMTVQKYLYIASAIACLARGLIFTFENSNILARQLYTPAICTYYALLTSSLALIVCYWCEIFFTEDAARVAANRPIFLIKSRLAFTIFNALLIGLLMIHFAASHFYDKELYKEQPPDMVFPALFATVLLIVHIMFLVIGVEIYCKVRGAFVTGRAGRGNVDHIQAIHSRLGLFFQWALTFLLVIFIVAEVAGLPQVMLNVQLRSVYEVTFRLLELGSVLWFPCILWNCTNPEKLWALNPKRLLKPNDRSCKVISSEFELRRENSNKSENCWICYDENDESELISPCKCKGDMAFVHHDCLRRWVSEQGENRTCRVCSHKYEIWQDSMSFDSALRTIHWAMVVPMIVVVICAPYGTYIICRQVDRNQTLVKHKALVQSAAVVICLLIEYAVIRLLGMSGLRLYRNAANAALRISSFMHGEPGEPIQDQNNDDQPGTSQTPNDRREYTLYDIQHKVSKVDDDQRGTAV